MILCKQIVHKISEAYFSAHASTLINPGRIRVIYYPGQRVIRVSDGIDNIIYGDGDPVSTLSWMPFVSKGFPRDEIGYQTLLA